MGQTIGIEIDRGILNLVGITQGHHPRIIGCASAELAKDWVNKEGISDPAHVAAALHEAMQHAQPGMVTGGGVYCSLPEAYVFRKVLELPVVGIGDEQIRDMVRLHVAEFLPEAVDHMEIDYQVLSSEGTDGNRQVVVVAASQKAIEGFMTVMSTAKLPIRVIEPAAASVARAVTNLRKPENSLVVDIGREVTTVAAYSQLVVQISSTVNVGAESAIPEKNEVLTESEQRERVEGLAAALADEINHVTMFAHNRGNIAMQPLLIMLTGEGSHLPGIAEVMAKQVELPVRLGTAIIPVPPACTRQYLTALGAALYDKQSQS